MRSAAIDPGRKVAINGSSLRDPSPNTLSAYNIPGQRSICLSQYHI